MKEHNAHTLNFNAKENHLVRGQLMDALEDEFAFFFNRAIPRAWRDVALKSFISAIREEFKNRPELHLSDSP